MDEHRIGLKPIVRRVWAPRGKRPVVDLHPRYRWRYLSGFVHPASGRTQWHLSSSVSLDLFASSLHHFTQQVGAGPSKEVVVVLDRAGWHASARLVVPEHVHLLPLPPYTPELQPAEHLWAFSNTPLVPLWSTRVRLTWRSWTRSNSIVVSPCKPTRRSSPPSSQRPTITGGSLIILQ
jgi:DDE superfamily endonuclease